MTAHAARHSVSVAAAVVDDHGKVLAIQRRDNAKWEPPGGVLGLHEPVLEGLIREVREETGLQIKPGPLSGVYKNVERGILALVFRSTHTSGDPVLTHETQDARWLAGSQISHYMDEAYAIRMLDALNEGPTQIRAHNGFDLLPDNH